MYPAQGGAARGNESMNRTVPSAGRIEGRLFRLMMALGAVCAGIGAGILWMQHAAPGWRDAHHDWIITEARLFEVGIRRSADSSKPFEMVARYEYKLDDRIFHASRIAGEHASAKPADIQALVVPYAAEAADFSLQDLSELNPQRTWSVAYRPVKVRYDPADVSRAELVLERRSRGNAFATWSVRVVAGMFLFTAAALFVGAAPVSRRASQLTV